MSFSGAGLRPGCIVADVDVAPGVAGGDSLIGSMLEVWLKEGLVILSNAPCLIGWGGAGQSITDARSPASLYASPSEGSTFCG